MKILVVDDEIKLADAIGELLVRHKYLADVVYEAQDGLYYAQNGDYDCIILDVMMPQMDGFEVAERLRKAKCNVPILMLTAKDDVASRVKGLDCGADDYLAKPFAVEELLARSCFDPQKSGNCQRYFDLWRYPTQHQQLHLVLW